MSTKAMLKKTTEDLTKDGGPLDLGQERSRLFVWLIRQVARGHPVSEGQIADIIAEMGLAPAGPRDFLEQWSERDHDGNVVGIGISLNETPHTYTTNGTRLFAWCALDTLVLPIVLNRAGHVESISPASGQTTTLDVTPEGIENIHPAGAVISLAVLEPQDIDISSVQAIWSTFCHRSYFFPSRDEADRWVSNKDHIAIASMDEGFDLARKFAARFLAYEH